MKIIIFCVFVFLILIEQLINLVIACKCSEVTKYCDTAWVAHVLTVNKEEVNIDTSPQPRYEVKILKSYRTSGEESCGNKNENDFITTSPINTDCDVTLVNGTEYLIGGMYSEGDKYINKCDSIIKKWNEITEELKKGLENGNMDCKKFKND
ncbi:hypothetical protein ACQ4LE_008945 [Meloidogyne hapla]|uniref:NTR domain-containing protein n=1 Tax=Meloidogyne hapla TaxID=6305 RepID=A0A1I8B6A4_MELHA